MADKLRGPSLLGGPAIPLPNSTAGAAHPLPKKGRPQPALYSPEGYILKQHGIALPVERLGNIGKVTTSERLGGLL